MWLLEEIPRDCEPATSDIDSVIENDKTNECKPNNLTSVLNYPD